MTHPGSLSALGPEVLADLDGLGVRSATRVAGGDIAQAYRLECDDGPRFLKTHPRPLPGMFPREAAGLRALRAGAPATLGVPRVVQVSEHALVLEWIEDAGRGGGAGAGGTGAGGTGVEEDLGRGLARLHAGPGSAFGSIDGDPRGYLGSVPVDQTPSERWPEFLLERRLVPLTERAVAVGALDPSARDLLRRCAARLDELCGPAEPPALVHGDLWAGNRMVDARGRNWLIDPACHWAHREIDVAMMHLFGGFGAACWPAYEEVHPLAQGWRMRIAWYQLTPLLVHAILFGGSYGASVLATLRRYA